MLNNIFVFDIETVPDVTSARRLYDLHDLSDEAVGKLMVAKRQHETEGASDFIRHHLQRVVAISAVFRHGDRLNVWSLGDEDADEADIIRRFFDGLERHTPTLVSWNGGGFDLPVLHYRALLHGIAAPRYWDTGNEDQSFRWNNYLSRYHWRHVDLMDVLSGYQPRATAPLHEIATLLGFPGKLGMSGKDVWPTYLAGGTRQIRQYCETDVLNTWLIYLHFERMRGNLLPRQYDDEIARVRALLAEGNEPHFKEFLAAWPDGATVAPR